MPRAASLLRLAYGALAAADTALAGASAPAAQRARRVTKPLLMPVLAAAFAMDPRSRRSPLGCSTRLAQVAGWGGDIALMGGNTPSFAAGMASFGLGQAAYIRGFRVVRDRGPLWRSKSGRLALALFVISGPPMALGAARQEPVLAPGVLAYAVLLAAMAGHAAHLDPALSAGARAASALGAVAFLASDTLIGVQQYLLADPPGWLDSVVMATYTAAQYLLAEGALWAGAQSAE